MSATDETPGPARVEVHHTSGESEFVELAPLNVRGIAAYVAAADDLARCAEILTGRPAGWANTITNRSVYDLLEAGDRVNEEGFRGYLAALRAQSARAGKLTEFYTV